MSIFIVAEIGINHNGDMSICKELIDSAVNAGCDAVKFQKRDLNIVYTDEFLDSPRESPWGSTQREQKMGLEFEYDEYKEIDRYCNSKNIHWFASAWDANSQKFLRQFDMKYNKIASAMIVDLPFLNLVASEKRYTFISTGMSNMTDISKAVEIFKSHNCPFELMHCVSTYPMLDEDANLLAINTMRDAFDCSVGYSGHEVGLAVSCAAAALGISSLERHITLDRAMYGSDQSSSIEPNGLRQLVSSVRKIELAMGDGVKKIHPKEPSIALKLRQHIDLEANH